MTRSSWFNLLITTLEPIPAIRQFLRAHGRTDTLRHGSRVAVVGRRLARRFGLPLAHSDLACLAHDLAAVVPLRHILHCADDLGVPLTAADRAIPQVVHGAVAAAVVQHGWPTTCPAVLNAIRYHTTLRADAEPLEQLVFIADKLAPDPTAQEIGYHLALLAAVRAEAPLPTLCAIYLAWAVRTGPRLGWTLHPDLLAAQIAFQNLESPINAAGRR